MILMLMYKRYIIRNIIPTLIVVVCSITSLMWVTQILKFLHLINKGVKIQDFLHLVILIIPFLLFILLPFATIIAIIYIYNSLSQRQQIVILQNLGLTNIQVASPALMVAVVVTLFAYYISASLLPLSYSKLKLNLNFMRNNYTSNMLDEKTFNKISKDIIVYFDKRLPNGVMENLIIFDNRKAANHAILSSRSGIFKMHSTFPVIQLQDGLRQVYDHNANLTNLSFDSLTVELVNNNTKESLDGSYDRELNEYYINELLKPNDNLSKQKKIKLIAEGHQRLIWPMYSFLLTFLTLSIFLKQPYNKKSNLKQILIIIFFVGIATYLHFALQNFASKDANYIFTGYANVVVIIIFSLYFYYSKISWN